MILVLTDQLTLPCINPMLLIMRSDNDVDIAVHVAGHLKLLLQLGNCGS